MKIKKTLKTAEEIVKLETGELRNLKRFDSVLVSVIAIGWALFQLSLASWLVLDSIKVRAIHLAFAVSLVFLLIPFRKKPGDDTSPKHIPLLDYLLCIVCTCLALYILFDWDGLVLRMGALNTRDLVLGSLLVLFLLEATRRAVGPALPVIIIVFTFLSFFSEYLPNVLAYRSVSVNKFINQVALSSEGVYGIPLGVSASIVYLFVLLGAMLERAGAGTFFTTLALSLLGRFKGGPAKAAIVSSGLSGLVSGSSIANIVTTGTFTIPLMKKVGYPAKKAAAIEVAASTDGQLMPPIMGAAAFIIAEYVNVPYLDVVKAAIIPAFVSYAALFFVTHVEASKLGMTGLPKREVPGFRATLKSGFHYLIPIGWLVVELVVLRHSPELSAFRAILILVVVIFFQEIYQARKNRETLRIAITNSIQLISSGCIKGSKNMIIVALATAAAGIIVGIVGMGLGGMITQIVEILSGGNVFLMLLITAIASLLLGMGLPTTATYIVMASLTAPIIVKMGALYGLFIPLMASHLFCFYFGILADDTPPVGLAAYAASAIAQSKPIPTGIQGFLYDLRTAIIPFFFVFNPDLILYKIDSFPLGVMIFIMAVLGAFAFTAAVQGWFVTRNKWYDVPLLLGATIILFNPKILFLFIDINKEYLYYLYLPGLFLLGTVFFFQKVRMLQK